MLSRPELLTSRHQLDAFACGDIALDAWVQRHARQAHDAGSTRVFVTAEAGARVVGLYALSAGSIARKEAPARVARGQANYPIPVALLTRLAVDHRRHGEGVGSALLKDAVMRVMGAADTIGIRCLLVHAANDSAQRFYLRHHFSPSPVDDMTLFMLLKDARASLAASSK